jgi:hypothetical protein
MLFTKYSEELLSVGTFFNLHEVICPSCALNVKRNHAFAVLALDASPIVLFATNNTLKAEPLLVNFTHSYWRLRGNDWAWGPNGAR